MQILRPKSKQPIPVGAKKIFSGILFDLYQWEQKQFDGTIKTFEKVKRKDTVGVLAVTKQRKIVLLEQEQPGTEPFMGLPGGIVDENEDILKAAKRELMEETGYASDTWEVFDATQPISKVDWVLYIFLAKDCEKISEPHLDSGEKINLKEVSWQEFLGLLTNEKFRDHELVLYCLKQLQQPNGEEKLQQQILG